MTKPATLESIASQIARVLSEQAAIRKALIMNDDVRMLSERMARFDERLDLIERRLDLIEQRRFDADGEATNTPPPQTAPTGNGEAAKRFFTRKEAIAELRISPSTFDHLLSEGKLIAKKHGHATIVMHDEIDRYLEQTPHAEIQPRPKRKRPSAPGSHQKKVPAT